MKAIKEAEDSAELAGVNTRRYKVSVYVLTAAMIGVLGGINAYWLTYISPLDVFSVIHTIHMIIMALFGGIGTVFGPVVGAVVLSLANEIIGAKLLYTYLLMLGVILLVVVIFLPGGFIGLLLLRRRKNEPSGDPAHKEEFRGPDGTERCDLRCGGRGDTGHHRTERGGEVHALQRDRRRPQAGLRETCCSGARASTTSRPTRYAGRGSSKTSQIVQPFLTLTVKENVLVALMFGQSLTKKEASGRADEILHFLKIADVKDGCPPRYRCRRGGGSSWPARWAQGRP